MQDIKLNIPDTVITCGESKLVGQVTKTDGCYFDFGCPRTTAEMRLIVHDWSFEYPLTLPEEVGTVIECDGVRFMKAHGPATDVWTCSQFVMSFWHHSSEKVLGYIKSHGGKFTVLLEGVKP